MITVIIMITLMSLRCMYMYGDMRVISEVLGMQLIGHMVAIPLPHPHPADTKASV